MYEVHMNKQDCIKRTETLSEAITFVVIQKHEGHRARFAIKLTGGGWYDWQQAHQDRPGGIQQWL